jgi:hypothetical protein
MCFCLTKKLQYYVKDISAAATGVGRGPYFNKFPSKTQVL